MSYPVAIVSDCGGQAMSRMVLRTTALIPDAKVVPFESASLLEAGGNIIDALDALTGCDGAIICNSAPRQEARDTNGGAICFGRIDRAILIATYGVLGMLNKACHDYFLSFRALNVDLYARETNRKRTRFNFRGLEVIPGLLLRLRRNDLDIQAMSSAVSTFPTIPNAVWHVDRIEGRPCNIKLTYLRGDFDKFGAGNTARVRYSEITRDIRCYERLTDIPPRELGMYEGSSGIGARRFLEVAVMGGSAAEELDLKVGDDFVIEKVL